MSDNILISEDHTNATEGYSGGTNDVFETRHTNKGELYREIMSEYGRCTGRVYVDGPDGEAVPIGWVFRKRQKYDDCNETYLADTWVTIHKRPATVVSTSHYVRTDNNEEFDA